MPAVVYYHRTSSSCSNHCMLQQDDVASCFEYYADLAEKLDKRQGETLQLPMEEFKGAIRREPMGEVMSMSCHKQVLSDLCWCTTTDQPISVPIQLKLSLLCRRRGPHHPLELSHANGCCKLHRKTTQHALQLNVMPYT